MILTYQTLYPPNTAAHCKPPCGWNKTQTQTKYPSTLANWTLIILFSEMLKFSNFISSKSENIVKDNSEYLRIFHLLRCIFQN